MSTSLLALASTLNLATLVTLLTASGLNNTFANPATLTLFGPTDAAFTAIPPPLVGWLTLPRNVAGLTKVLTYHALPVTVFSPSISTTGTPLASLCTTCTPSLTALRDNSTGAVTINTVPVVTTVTSADNNATNGVLHVVDRVLVPSGVLPTNDIVAAAKATPSLSTLYSLLNSTGLLPALTLGTNSFTVFAPSNTAFDSVPSYIKNNVTLLTKVLLYHVINGRTYASDLPDNSAVVAPTLNTPQSLSILRNGASVVATGSASAATVTTADVDCTNGVVHIVDTVLLPAGVLTNNLLTTATTLALTTLVSLLNTSGLTAPFVAPGSTLTLFGPTNAAFNAIPAPLLGWLTHPRAANLAGLQSVLTYHALPAKVFSPAISTTAGTPLASLCTTCTPVLSALRNATTGAVTINTAPVTSVTSANNAANNGVLHQISAVLVPSGVLPTNDIVAAAKATPSLSTLYSLLNSTGLLPALTLGTNSFTVFAPSNTAFDSVPSYIRSNATLLTKVLLYHVINGRTYASDLPNNTAVVVPTLNTPQTLSVLRRGASVVVTASASVASVTTADVDCSNGVVHIVDTVLVPAGVLSASPTPSVTAAVTVTPTPFSVPNATAAPSNSLSVVFSLLVQTTDDGTALKKALADPGNVAAARALRDGLFRGARIASSVGQARDFLGVSLQSVGGQAVAPGAPVNSRRALAAAVTVTVALTVGPDAGGAAQYALAQTIADDINKVLLVSNSPVLANNLASAVAALAAANAQVQAGGIAGVPGSAAVPSSSSDSNSGAIIGGTIGGIALLAAVVGGAWYWRKRSAGYESVALKGETQYSSYN